MRGFFPNARRGLLPGILLLVCAQASPAYTNLKVDIGWGGQMRTHRWAPVIMTASDSQNRNVILEVYWPHGGSYAMRIGQVFAIGPTPTTFELLLPVQTYFAYQNSVFTLRDADTGRTLTRFPSQPGSWFLNNSGVSSDAGVVGVSGRRSELDSLRGNTNAQQIAIEYMEPSLRPTAALGYDTLDLLVLNAPNLSLTPGANSEPGIALVQQQAILDGVRAGGNLILWPGAGSPFPSGGPLVDVLPARLGDVTSISLTGEQASRLGLADRPLKINSYQLTPEAGAQRIELLNAQSSAYAKRLGLGRIVLLPMDAGRLSFPLKSGGQDFWKPLVEGMHVLPKPADGTTQQNLSPYLLTRDDQKETAAAMRVADALGDVPGAGSFGFGYVVLVMAGMMIVVGPVDWFVLKRLGRQPWTWVTTSGWILLITLGAVGLGSVLKSGDLHYRTLRLIDQVGDASIASIDYVGIYSPRTQRYALATNPESWWQPGGVEDYSRSNMSIDMPFHQTYAGNTPEPMSIGVWSLRFFRADEVGAGPPIIAASLSRRSNPERIVGVIKNLTERPIKELHVRSGNKTGNFVLRQETPATGPATAPADSAQGAKITQIGAFATVRVEAELQEEPRPDPNAKQQQLRYYAVQEDPNEPLWQAAQELDMRRETRINEILASDSVVCIYGEIDQPAPATKLINQKPIEQHWEFIRAVVELKKE
jgi:hypothetical protein